MVKLQKLQWVVHLIIKYGKKKFVDSLESVF